MVTLSNVGADVEKNIVPEVNDASKRDSDNASADFQPGVKRVRAVASVWSKKTLWLTFALLYLVAFVDMLLVSVQSTLNPFITSSFEKHGLLASVSIVATILSGCSTLTLAKIVDVWGRIEGFLFMLLVVVVALIMKATCKNMEAYVAAHTLYWTGHIGMIYCVDVMLADMTTLRNRMIMFSINNTPTIASTFAGPKIADLFFSNLNFRWAFGAFAIMLVGVSLPVIVIMLFMERKSVKAGFLVKEKSGRSAWESIKYHLIEFDVVGIVLITASFALILLPFSIVVYAPKGWATGYIIAMEVVGVVCGAIFLAWERFLAPVQFLPFKYLKNPTIIGSCLLYGVMFASAFCWNAYFYSYLIVVYRLTITTAGYVLNSFSLSSAILAPGIGFLIRYTGNFKWAAYAGIPFMLLGTALLIPFRQPNTSIGAVTITQVLVGIGTSFFSVCGQLAVMSVVSHQEVAVVLAIWGMFGSIGASVGLAVAGAMWNNILPSQLYRRLPEESKAMAAQIFGDMQLQMSYLDGTPERDAIVGAYADVQRKMVIAGVCMMPLVMASIVIWRNVNIKKQEEEEGSQTTGNIF
ncbi:siderochrome-iron transporter MirB [Histoplasma ohiense]|nr:siderochrome-iron transporter MirB [Histoplasma ohiense (nom. inval.)]